MALHEKSESWDYTTIRKDSEGRWSVHGFGTYERSSVMAGQSRKVWLDSYETREEAQAAYPDAGAGHDMLDPQPSYHHLPDDGDGFFD